MRLSSPEKVMQIDNSDLIIYYSSDFYNEDELAELKTIAFKISNEKNKRVSIGYQYSIPFDQRPDPEVMEQIAIISYKNGKEFVEITYPTPYSTVYDLVELTLVTADNLDINRQPRLEK